jgi:hypothetical protein
MRNAECGLRNEITWSCQFGECIGDELGPIAAGDFGDGEEGTPVVAEAIVSGGGQGDLDTSPFLPLPVRGGEGARYAAACVQNPKAHAFQHFEIFRYPGGELDCWKYWIKSSNEEEEEEEEDTDKAGY